MNPILVEFGPFTIKAYGLMLMVGFLSGIWMGCRRAEKAKADPDVILNMGFIAIIFGILGARIFYVIHYFDRDFAHQKNVILAIIDVSRGGLEFYGGLIGGMLAIIIYLWTTRRSIRWYLDIAAPTLAWGLAWTRIGCFLNGCCWGGACDLPWGVQFPYGSAPFSQQWSESNRITLPKELIFNLENGSARIVHSSFLDLSESDLEGDTAGGSFSCSPGLRTKVIRDHLRDNNISLEELRRMASELRSHPVHPTQLYSSINAFLLYILTAAFFWRRRRHGTVAVMLLMVYPISRFLLEIIRSDNPHDTVSLTASQFVSVGMFAVAVLWWLALRRLPERSRYAVPLEPLPTNP